MASNLSNTTPMFTVSGFLAVLNQTLEYSYPSVEIEGEVASFKVNQGKWVFFDLKDAEGSVGCFMTLFQLRVPIEDGMKVIVRVAPKVTPWGKFSLTVQSIRPSGEGSLKKSFELLKAKLEKEGLFGEDRKRPLPRIPGKIAVVSSTQAAGYADFIKILGDRWGGLSVEVAHVQVQGESAADQIVRAINYFNEQEELAEVLVVIRGGGSADDLSTFNDEQLVRAIASSRIPTLVGVGHEVDETLADFAADVRAATPSNAAQIVVPDKSELVQRVAYVRQRIGAQCEMRISAQRDAYRRSLGHIVQRIEQRHTQLVERLRGRCQALEAYSPEAVLARGYAVVRGTVAVGAVITIERQKDHIEAEVRSVNQK